MPLLNLVVGNMSSEVEETRDGDSSHQLVRIARTADKRHSSWGCKKCSAIWPKWQDVQSAVGEKLDSVCHGVDDRINRLRSQSVKRWWSARPEVSRASAKKHLKLTKREVCLLSSSYHQVAKEFGPPTRIVHVYNQATRIRKARQTPASVRRAAPLVRHAAGPGKVKELLDRARKRLVENGVEPNPGPFGSRLAFRRVTGRAVLPISRSSCWTGILPGSL